ncbi:hypothetical protein ACP70R_014186 [Stipagrostis hirtigluma subsp. patula]
MQAAAMADAGGGPGYLLGGLACCCAGAGCYFLGKSRLEYGAPLGCDRRGGFDEYAICDVLNSMTLDSSFGYLSLVTISGRVGSDTPIIGQQIGLQAAIVEQHVTQHFLKKQQKRKGGAEYLVVKKTKEKCGDEHLLIKKQEEDDEENWIRCSEQLSSTRKEVPWYLDDGTGRLDVVGARTAHGFALSLGSEIFEKQPQSCGCQCSVKILGQMRTEQVLQIRSKLTVVGEACKDSSGKILIQRPRNGGPFHVSSKSVDEIISDLGLEGRICQFGAVALAASGVFLLGGYALS